MRCSSYHATVCLLLTFASSMPLLFLGCGGGEEAVENDPYAGSIVVGEGVDQCAYRFNDLAGGCQPNIQVTGSNLSFDGEMIEGQLRIINSGQIDLRLQDFTLEGSAAEVIQFESSSEINGQAMADLTSEPPVPVYIAPNARLALDFRWDSEEDISDTTFVIRSNDPDSQEVRVSLDLLMPEPTNNQTTEPEPSCVDVLAVASVRGDDAPPASELEVPPLSTLEFEVQASDDVLERIERFEWSIIKAPEGSTARLTPNNTAPRPSLFIDIVGGYTVELIAVIGDSGDVLEFCNEQKVEVYAVPCDPCSD